MQQSKDTRNFDNITITEDRENYNSKKLQNSERHDSQEDQSSTEESDSDSFASAEEFLESDSENCTKAITIQKEELTCNEGKLPTGDYLIDYIKSENISEIQLHSQLPAKVIIEENEEEKTNDANSSRQFLLEEHLKSKNISDAQLLKEVTEQDKEHETQAPSKDIADSIRAKWIEETLLKLVISEAKYVSDLHILADVYLPYLKQRAPSDLLGKISPVFTSVTNLYEAAERFGDILKQDNKDANYVISIFANSAAVFDSYSQYIRHVSGIYNFLPQTEAVVKDKLLEREDKQSFASYLLSPIYRLEHYVAILESIQKTMSEIQSSTATTVSAITLLQNAKAEGNTLSAIDSIKSCPIDLLYLGKFIMKNNFKIIKLRKTRLTAFLFEKAIVFTKKIPGKGLFAYDNILNLDQLVLDKHLKQTNTFSLLLYTTSKKGKRESVTYALEAETSKIKNEWVSEIGARLWGQLTQIREVQKQLSVSENDGESSAVSPTITPVSLGL